MCVTHLSFGAFGWSFAGFPTCISILFASIALLRFFYFFLLWYAKVSHLKELLGICREYINAVRIKEALSDPDNDNVRVTELGAYFTHCNMEIAHLMLALDLAMTKSFKNKNYMTAAAFARRLLELPDVSLEKNAKLRYVG